MEKTLLELIDEALREVRPMADAGFAPAGSIARQLDWCRKFELGLPTDPRPGPFSMGLIAVREFDMYGDQPELSRSINQVQRLIEAKLTKR